MRRMLGFGAALAVIGLIGTLDTAYGQAGADGKVGRGTSTAGTAENALQGNALPGETNTGTTATSPPTVGTLTGTQAPATSGTGTTVPGTVTSTATPATAYQSPGTTGIGTMNPAAGTTTAPGYLAPGVVNRVNPVNPGAVNRTYSSNYYATGAQPAMAPGTVVTNPANAGAVGMPGMGYNSVNPMGTTMPAGSYYQGAGPGNYVAPAYGAQYPVRQRRGLFGGMFRRRNRQVYTTAPYGAMAPSTYSYAPAPTTYTYAPASPY